MTPQGEPHGTRNVVTPEGVTIPFRLAPAGDRALAFLIDVVLIHAAMLALVLAGLFSVGLTGTFGISLALVLSFLLRNFYFVYMELHWGGTTLGKRRLGLRVVSRDGGPLTADAVFARNLTRDLEFFLPLAALVQPRAIVPTDSTWGALIASSWLFVFACLPLLNRNRLRCGDIVGGTLVVQAPRAVLLADLVHLRALPAGREEGDRRYRFTTAQLDLYGIHELQVLEDVLRDSGGWRNHELLSKICERIQNKIGWPAEQRDVDEHAFLLAFYRAQRARLEHRMLLGDRRERKRR